MRYSKLQSLVMNGRTSEASDAYNKEFGKLKRHPVARFEWIKHGAILGISDAVGHVVDAYQKGTGVEPNQANAFEWQSRAAETGSKNFFFELALAYRDGNGTAISIPKFWEWMTKAATAPNSTEAMYQLARAHLDVNLGRFSPQKAFDWTKKMADAGAPGGQIELAKYYRDGYVVKQDRDEFLSLSKQAVASAKKVWEEAKVELTKGKHGKDFVYEDYPNALVLLADAYDPNSPESLRLNREAASAAEDAMAVKTANGETESSRLLIEISLRRRGTYLTAEGVPIEGGNEDYFQALVQAASELKRDLTTSEVTDPLPQRLSKVLLDLAHAYRKGTGTPSQSRFLYLRYLIRAANAANGEGAYELGMLHRHRKRLKLKDSETLIAKAAETDHDLANIARALSDCQLENAEFIAVLALLRSLWKVVQEIRTAKHSMTAEEMAGEIAHYTDSNALNSMLDIGPEEAKNCLRLYSLAYVNVPREGHRLTTFETVEFENPLRPFFVLNEKKNEPSSWEGQSFLVFLGSFSLQPDRLDLWRFYGRNGAGFSVVTPATAFGSPSDREMMRGAWAKTSDSLSPINLYKGRFQVRSATVLSQWVEGDD